jgi:glutamyl-tRNA synthetase
MVEENITMEIRTRFAPSPTGHLHIGGVRTALYAWLYARHCNGKFILRIEDTDLERSSEEATRVIIEGMNWLGLDHDEGPFFQSQRMARYNQVLEQLLNDNKAYRCYCSKERLDDLREKQLTNKEKPRYDGLCRTCPTRENQPFVIRFRNPDSGVVSFEDQVHGMISFQNHELDDLIIARSDGSPTYNFCVVVDDLDMKITHVIRGDDHINNTPRQINLLQALGAKLPVYAHVPMILGSDGKKLSKRHGASNVLEFLEAGFLPDAILNFLIRLGWAHGDQEIFSRAEMIELFDLKDINKAPSAMNQDKLLWLNQHYMKTDDPEKVAQHLMWHMQQQKIDITNGPKLSAIVKVLAERCHTLKELAEKSRYFYEPITGYDEKAKKHLTKEIAPALKAVREQYEKLNDWQAVKIHEILTTTAEKLGLKLGQIAQPIRVAVTGGTVSPPLDMTLELIGKQRVLERLDHVLENVIPAKAGI